MRTLTFRLYALPIGFLRGGAVTPKRTFLLFVALYLLSIAAFIGWFVLALVGLLNSDVLAFANRIGAPTLIGSTICMVVFRRLARRAEKRLGSTGPGAFL
jgi:hypothetical protein